MGLFTMASVPPKIKKNAKQNGETITLLYVYVCVCAESQFSKVLFLKTEVTNINHQLTKRPIAKETNSNQVKLEAQKVK